MSITAVFPVLQRPWKGYDDPGLPVGMWIAQGLVTGDASGGSQRINFTFKGEGEPLGARFYNLEQMEAHSTLATTFGSALVLEGFDIISAAGLINRRIAIELISDGITDAEMLTAGIRLPLFLGRPQLVDIASAIVYERNNVLNEATAFTAQGYIWEPRSLLQDGGLRRPLDSLYG